MNPAATMVGRPRAASVLLWCVLLALGLFALVRTTGLGLVIGVLFGVVGVFGLGSAARSRVWVDGAVLRYRTLFGDRPPVRLDRLVRADLTSFDRASGRLLHLADSTGSAVAIDATNLRLTPLYAVLADHLRPDSPVANDQLRRRMRTYLDRGPARRLPF